MDHRSILMSVLAIGVTAAMLGAGTMAFFSDEEKSEGNILQAGTLDFEMTVGDGVSGHIEFMDVKPCQDLEPFYVRFINVGQNEGKVSWVLTYEECDKPDPATYAPDSEGIDLSADAFAMLVFVDYAVFDRDCDGIIEPFGADMVCAYDGKHADEIGNLTDEDLNQDDTTETGTSGDLDDQMAYVLANWTSPISYVYPWPGAPLGIDDEWVLPDWARWADMVNGNNDDYLSIYEVARVSWTIDDLGGDTMYLDPGEIYMHKIGLHLADALDAEGHIELGVLNNDPQGDGICMTVTVHMEQVV